MKSTAKKDTLSKHKEKAWKAFSIYIRTRDCLKTTWGHERGTCITCNREYPLKQLQAGHFIDGRNNAVLFSEKGVHAQCYACNVRLHGNKVKYWLYMEQTYGHDVIDELIAESNQQVIYSREDFDEIAEKYKQKTVQLIASNY